MASSFSSSYLMVWILKDQILKPSSGSEFINEVNDRYDFVEVQMTNSPFQMHSPSAGLCIVPE